MAEAEPTFSPARVLSAWDETPTFRGVRLRLAGPLAASHRPPGQVVQLRAPEGRAGYFALASAPDPEGNAELLIKRGPPLAEALLAAARPGATLEATAPMGPGFPIEEALGRDVLLFATGSGISPIRALLQRFAADRGTVNRIRLYYGQRAEHDFAYAREHDRWRRAGIDLFLCCSRPGPGWGGPTGHVQNVARAHLLEEPPPPTAVAFVAGLSAMVKGVLSTLGELGLPAARVFKNH